MPSAIPPAFLAAALAALAACEAKVTARGQAPAEPSGEVAACTGCHGSAGNSAPPRSVTGATATSDVAVGAHQTHLTPGPFRKAVNCGDCHPVPMTAASPGHGDGVVDVVFGGLATAGGATPKWNRASMTCGSVYCHGATLPQGPASKNTPVWTVVFHDPTNPASQVACGTCHGIPPANAAHAGQPQTSPPYAASATMACSKCHPDTVQPDGTLDIAGGHHIDGVVEIGAAACTTCHGDPARTPVALAPAPPQARHAPGGSGATATSNPAVGAHLAHLTGTSWRGAALDCAECHREVDSLTINGVTVHPSPQGVTDLTWGPLATAGGADAAYDKTTVPAAPQCTNYCHGSTLQGGTVPAPVWTRVDGTQAACGACHGLPPPTTAHATVGPSTSCADCHGGYEYTQAGKVAPTCAPPGCVGGISPATHIDGYVNVGSRTCTSCHGDAGRTPAFLAPAPPTATNNSTVSADVGVGAHLTHLLGGPVSRPVACSECHPSVTSTEHADGKVDLVFGPLATSGLSHPVYKRPAVGSRACMPGECTCATNYCHGSTLGGGTNTTPTWTAVGVGQTACGSCHGVPPPAPHTQRNDCSTCHAGYTTTTVNLALHIDGRVDATGGACTDCHGDPQRTPATIAAAPPVNAGPATGTPWAASDPGAHLKHLTGTLLRKTPIACGECHLVPAGPPGPAGSGDTHGDGAATVVFGSLATTGGAQPTWNTPVALGCAASYCHGGTLAGGTNTAPLWNETGGAASACGACHGNPPPTTAQGGTHPDVAATQNCNGCHAGYNGVRGGAITVNTTLHLNGVVDTSNGTGGCASCHGDPQRTPAALAPAPPAAALGVNGATPPWAGGEPGAHLAHLTGTTLASAPVACSECHTAVTTSDATGTHRNGTADVAFGSMARAGGATPTWNSGTLGCAASYCHGATLTGGTRTTPTWAETGGAASACGACHGVPPADTNHTGLPGGTACSSCHTGYGGTVGGAPASFTLNKAVHLNGTIDAAGSSCTSCHGTATRTLVAGADPQTPAAPPMPAGPNTSPWYAADNLADPNGAHFRHLNHALATALSKPIACAECHVVPSTMAPSGTHENGTADVVFGTLSKTNGAAPTWNPGTLGCAASYCHGGTMAGGTRTTPAWNVVDGTQVACTACHGMPPATVAKGARTHPVSSGTDCGNCHTGYTATKVNVSLHVNGAVDASTSCTSCHGDATRVLVTGADAKTASAPPVNAPGAAWAGFGVGAHQAHLNKGTGAIGAHVACSECHTVYAAAPTGGTDKHGNGVAEVVFGSRAKTGGAVPTYNAGSATVAPGCAASYCHGNFTFNPNSHGVLAASIAWNATGPLACRSCHTVNASGVPVPNDSCHPPNFNHDGGNSCSSCHKNVNSTGTAITNATTHVDGTLNGKCTDCHRNNTKVCQ